MDLGNSNVIGLVAAVIGLLIIIFGASLLKFKPRKLNSEKFKREWQEVQSLCKSRTTWPLAVINGDKLLDEALKKSHLKGKTMGERLVSAQKLLSDNDSVWYGHKLRNRLVHEEVKKLQQKDVMNALSGFRQALRDLGAL